MRTFIFLMGIFMFQYQVKADERCDGLAQRVRESYQNFIEAFNVESGGKDSGTNKALQNLKDACSAFTDCSDDYKIFNGKTVNNACEQFKQKPADVAQYLVFKTRR